MIFGIADFKEAMESEFEMTDLALMKFFLGIEVQQSRSHIFISLTKYASEFLKIFNMSNCKTTPTLVITGLKLSKDDDGSTVDPTSLKRLVGSLNVSNSDKTRHHVWSKCDLKIHVVTKRFSLASR